VSTFENTVMIARPIEDVFAFLSDLENIPKWNYAIVETRKISEGPIGVDHLPPGPLGSESQRRTLGDHHL
jgi:Polyketide cyclase / dehydrase and lipid transport